MISIKQVEEALDDIGDKYIVYDNRFLGTYHSRMVAADSLISIIISKLKELDNGNGSTENGNTEGN